MRAFITGAVKAGKSAYALSRARTLPAAARFFVATAEASDTDMVLRIKRHRAERRKADGYDEFITIEESLKIDEVFSRTTKGKSSDAVWIVDCLTMWVNNLLFYQQQDEFEQRLSGFIVNLPLHCFIVSNETGLGNIAFDPETRLYNQLLAEANRRVAAVCDQVILMVAGLPLFVKGGV